MRTSTIIKSVKRFCSKFSSLLLLFQRAPLIQALLPEASVLSTSGVMNALPAAITTVAGLGFFDAVAGATSVAQVTPLSGSLTVPVTAGVQLIGSFQVTGIPYTPGSWRITSGTLPDGLTLANLANRATSLTGRTTQTGSFPVTITAYRYANFAGSTASRQFTIAVTHPPAAAITTQPVSTTINSGSTVTLTVVAAGTAPFTYQWYQGPLNNTTLPVGTNSASFTSPALFATTSYWVKVTNTANPTGAISTLATVTVNQPAAITSPLNNVTINAGETTQLSVSATGTAPLTYQWYQGNSPNTGVPLSGTNSANFTTPALVASANYWVKVTNSANVAGANSTTAAVTVLPLLSTWKNSHFNSTQLANPTISGDSADPDGDGITNIREYLFGTAPLISQASLLATSRPSAGQFQMSFTARAATGAGYHGKTRHYAIETTSDPSTSWTLLAGFENIIATGQQVNAVVPTTLTKRFYRMKTWLTP
jgi:hypothetical protein